MDGRFDKCLGAVMYKVSDISCSLRTTHKQCGETSTSHSFRFLFSSWWWTKVVIDDSFLVGRLPPPRKAVVHASMHAAADPERDA